jgi:tetratricopeptide (TPR) repeat protein
VNLQRSSLYPDDRTALWVAAELDLAKALYLAPEHAVAHAALGHTQILTNRAVQGMAECKRALELDRNLANAHATIGVAKFTIGCAKETEAHVQQALRLSPRDTFAHHWMVVAGTANLLLGRDEDAVSWFRRSIEMGRNYSAAHFRLAAALVHLDRLGEARLAAKAGLAITPAFTMRRFRGGAISDNPTFLAQRERVAEGMRKAGIPEG